MTTPIPIYNADGTQNKGGDITEITEFWMTIREHREHINLAITDLRTKDIYLRHDWLKCHNPSINWKTGNVIFGCCQCIKNLLELPDADPDD